MANYYKAFDYVAVVTCEKNKEILLNNLTAWKEFTNEKYNFKIWIYSLRLTKGRTETSDGKSC